MNKEIIDVEPKEEVKPTIEIGNYFIEVISDGEVIKKIAVANSEINITKLSQGGLAVDLK
ncbi:Uncharacterised protein [Clostridium putrefaciens]|uniref:Uncharacterized protein n=1 Tax=Clostridium putrefaciens TaxID=99675 RepID=A0A381J8L9_9CLOT|nr:hypothetical protein [Clostridium putrefaciens]SUY47048.1 Uncharacterised protein [Clostridium putrefaciens]